MSLVKPALDPATQTPRTGSTYPKRYKAPVEGRLKLALGDLLGLGNFGVNLVTLPPGVWSAQRHWHSAEDEFVYVLEGSLTLVTEAGEQLLTAGMVAGFPAGVADGHCLVNKSDAPARYLEVGDRRDAEDRVDYPDIDLRVEPSPEGRRFVTKAGEPC